MFPVFLSVEKDGREKTNPPSPEPATLAINLRLRLLRCKQHQMLQGS